MSLGEYFTVTEEVAYANDRCKGPAKCHGGMEIRVGALTSHGHKGFRKVERKTHF